MFTLRICRIGSHKTVNFAVVELARYLKKIDSRLPIDRTLRQGYDEDNSLYLYVGLSDKVAYNKHKDEIFIDVNNGVGIITAANERGVLIAVYRFLRELGCRFIRPGEDGDIIPKRRLTAADLTVSVHETPSVKDRIICIEGCPIYEHVQNVIDWIPKNGMNGYYIQYNNPIFYPERWYTHTYDEHSVPEPYSSEDSAGYKAMLDEELAKRSLVYYAVGHGWTHFPFGIETVVKSEDDPRLTEEYKSYLAEINGVRGFYQGAHFKTQLCYSNPKVREIITDAAVKYAKEHPEVDLLRFALGDGFNNYCECESCRKMRPADHLMIILNELDEKLTREGLDVRVSFPIYVDLIWPPEKVKLKNPARFYQNLSPSSRTYSKPLYELDRDPDSIELPPYVQNKLTIPSDTETLIAFYKKWQEWTGCECIIYDYHLFWDHFLDVGYTEISKLIHKDATGLSRLNFVGYTSCQPQSCSFPTGLPMYVMAHGFWNKDSVFEDVTKEYYEAAFGERAEEVEGYLTELSRLFNRAFIRNDVTPCHKAVTDRMEAAIRLIDETEAAHLWNVGDEADSFKYLYYHGEYMKRYAKLVLLAAKPDTEAFEAAKKELMEYHFANQAELHTVLDGFSWARVYNTMLSKLFANEPENNPDFL